MKLLTFVGLLCFITLSSSTFAEEEKLPNVVQIEGMSEMLTHLRSFISNFSLLTGN